MPNPNTFDEASEATMGMFANDEQMSFENAPPAENPPVEGEPGATEPPAEEMPTENPPAETQEPPVQEPGAEVPPSAIEQAAQAAEVAAQVASEKDGELQRATAEIEALRRQNQQLQGTIDEISRRNTDTVIDSVLKPPTLDINALAFADEETQSAAVAQFVKEMGAYNRQEFMKEISPALEFAKKGMRDAEIKDVVSTFSQIPELANIQEMLPQLDRIIANNKWLQSDDMPLDEKYLNAYAMARGIDVINNPPTQPEPAKEPTPEELLAMYNNNPAFQELVEKQRLDTIKESQQVPPFSASSGAVNAALNIEEEPRTLEEASARARKMFDAE